MKIRVIEFITVFVFLIGIGGAAEAVEELNFTKVAISMLLMIVSATAMIWESEVDEEINDKHIRNDASYPSYLRK